MGTDDYDSGDVIAVIMFCILSMLVGVLVGVLIYSSVVDPVQLTQETGDQICLNFTNVQGVVAESDSNGILICNIPTFDSTQNIIIKNNGENK